MSTTPAAFCQFCGSQITASSRFCSNCGQSQPSAPAAPAVAAAPAPAFAAPVAYAAAPTTAVYAGFWMRFIAVIIDSLVVGIVTGPITFIVQIGAGIGGGLTKDKPE